ncbi:glycoside hydrolase family 16 protein [Auriscalpium vulgare]|uniref:Glycoside hydrolase family 16 protein n=1 Tax=Auriscalpium vulgare TaxID=40419 RepID=A0ACB8R8H9_9AGAM|nr:glycoside hydrolase family 16 protein [Auriscalpium vulgare]
MHTTPRRALLAALYLLPAVTSYDVVREYSGNSFFDRWDFYGSYDNLTLGDVWWLDQPNATQQGLAYVDGNGRAVMRVDNTTNVPWNYKRNSIRITSQDFYDVGSLWVIDLTHIPYGCSVWPAFWTKGPLWPNDGEIDIIEAINLEDHNQYALHTTGGCVRPEGTVQTGALGPTDCSLGSGCVVSETKPNSYSSGFTQMGGGVYATQFDVAGIFIWFWSRADVPQSLLQANSTSSIDISQWGIPSASYPASGCNITNYFTSQQLVFDITLCGDWAGVPSIYQAACNASGPTGICYNDNVVGNGSNYDEAYFEVNYLRAYTTTAAPAATPSASQGVSVPVISATGSLAGPTGINTSPNGAGTKGGNGAVTLGSSVVAAGLVAAASFVLVLLL